MTWAIVHGGTIIYRGPYGQCLDAAETFGLCARAYHLDGTELTPRLAPGVFMMPEDMLPARYRRRAA